MKDSAIPAYLPRMYGAAGGGALFVGVAFTAVAVAELLRGKLDIVTVLILIFGEIWLLLGTFMLGQARLIAERRKNLEANGKEDKEFE